MVEDDAKLRGILARGLGENGHAVDVAEDGLEAIAWEESYPYDLLILDVVLPGLDGFGVCARVRERGSTVPILMLTALDQLQDRVAVSTAVPTTTWVKPFAMAELRARVRALRRQTEGRLPTIKVHDLSWTRPRTWSDGRRPIEPGRARVRDARGTSCATPARCCRATPTRLSTSGTALLRR